MKKTVQEIRTMLREAEETAINEMLDLMRDGEERSAVEIARATGENMSVNQIVGNLRNVGRSNSRFSAIAHESKRIMTRERKVTKRFAELNEHGELAEGGRMLEKDFSTTTYTLVNPRY